MTTDSKVENALWLADNMGGEPMQTLAAEVRRLRAAQQAQPSEPMAKWPESILEAVNGGSIHSPIERLHAIAVLDRLHASGAFRSAQQAQPSEPAWWWDGDEADPGFLRTRNEYCKIPLYTAPPQPARAGEWRTMNEAPRGVPVLVEYHMFNDKSQPLARQVAWFYSGLWRPYPCTDGMAYADRWMPVTATPPPQQDEKEQSK